MRTINIGIIGGGTVGGGVVQALRRNGALMASRLGVRLRVGRIAVRSPRKKRSVKLPKSALTSDWKSVVNDPKIDLVVELIGGITTAKDVVLSALRAGKPVVTANKALLAFHGEQLFATADKYGANLYYEASVAGGVPIIKVLREALVGNRVTRLYGILNGTCNFILSKMEAEGRDFADVLDEAQRLGFAEADPSFDIDGIDAAHKLSILASLAFGSCPAFGAVDVTGIRHVIAADIAEAAALGYRVRLVGLAEAGAAGLFQRVHPHLVPLSHPLAHVTGALNAVVAEGNYVGRLFFQGRGAGDGPTASAVVADLIDIARGEYGPPYAMPADALTNAAPAATGERLGRAYVRFTVADKVGVLAEIAAAMRDAGVSIESLMQRGAMADGSVLVAIVTHEGPERAVAQALEKLRGSQSLVGEPMWMHILED